MPKYASVQVVCGTLHVMVDTNHQTYTGQPATACRGSTYITYQSEQWSFMSVSDANNILKHQNCVRRVLV